MRWPLYLGLKVKLILLTVVLMLGLSAKVLISVLCVILQIKALARKPKTWREGKTIIIRQSIPQPSGHEVRLKPSARKSGERRSPAYIGASPTYL